MIKKYEKYKDSGVEWIGKIPSGWEVKKVKYLTENFDGKRIPLNSTERSSIQGDYPYYGATGVVDYVNGYIFDGSYVLIGEDGAPFFIFGKDVAFHVRGKFWVNNHAHILLPIKDNPIILTHLFNSVDYKNYISGSTRDKLTQDQLSSIQLLEIPLPEQTAIASFLDRKTAEIDQLIANKEKLIALYEEEKTAIINQAVTKGLDPKVNTKPSGVEWLGDIPEHWEMKRLKYLSDIQTGGKDTENREDDGEYPFYVPGTPSARRERGELSFAPAPVLQAAEGGLSNNRWSRKITSSDKRYALSLLKFFCSARPVRSQTIERISTYSFDGEAILTAGDGVGVGKVFHYANGKFDYHQRVYRISDFKEVKGKFLFYYMKSYFYKEVIRLSAKSTVDSLRLPMLQDFPVVLPKKDEQTAIVAHIKTECSRLDTIIEKFKKQIDLFKEYRTTLISEVVTGKIDVRDEVAA